MFQLYAQHKLKGWVDEDKDIRKGRFISEDLDELVLLAEKLDPHNYYEYMIIEHRKDGDRTVRNQQLYQECEVEYSDDVKTSFEVKATTFKVSRTKKKEELKKEIDKYYNGEEI